MSVRSEGRDSKRQPRSSDSSRARARASSSVGQTGLEEGAALVVRLPLAERLHEVVGVLLAVLLDVLVVGRFDAVGATGVTQQPALEGIAALDVVLGEPVRARAWPRAPAGSARGCPGRWWRSRERAAAPAAGCARSGRPWHHHTDRSRGGWRRPRGRPPRCGRPLPGCDRAAASAPRAGRPTARRRRSRARERGRQVLDRQHEHVAGDELQPHARPRSIPGPVRLPQPRPQDGSSPLSAVLPRAVSTTALATSTAAAASGAQPSAPISSGELLGHRRTADHDAQVRACRRPPAPPR